MWGLVHSVWVEAIPRVKHESDAEWKKWLDVDFCSALTTVHWRRNVPFFVFGDYVSHRHEHPRHYRKMKSKGIIDLEETRLVLQLEDTKEIILSKHGVTRTLRGVSQDFCSNQSCQVSMFSTVGGKTYIKIQCNSRADISPLYDALFPKSMRGSKSSSSSTD